MLSTFLFDLLVNSIKCLQYVVFFIILGRFEKLSNDLGKIMQRTSLAQKRKLEAEGGSPAKVVKIEDERMVELNFKVT